MFLLESVFTHEKLAESVQIRSSFQWCELRFVLLLGLNFLILFPVKDPGLILIYPCHLSRAAFRSRSWLGMGIFLWLLCKKWSLGVGFSAFGLCWSGSNAGNGAKAATHRELRRLLWRAVIGKVIGLLFY